jgi:hypothetical protein
MSTNCTRTRARRRQGPAVALRRRVGVCPYRAVPGHGLDDVLHRVGDVGTMTVAELRRALLVLGRPARTRRMDVLKARLRVAVRLEELDG